MDTDRPTAGVARERLEGMPTNDLVERLRTVAPDSALLLEVERVPLSMPSADERAAMKAMAALMSERRIKIYVALVGRGVAGFMARSIMTRMIPSESGASEFRPIARERFYTSVDEASDALRRDGWSVDDLHLA